MLCVAFCLFKTIHNLHYEQIGKEVRCIEDELPFEIPSSWQYARLGSLLIKLTDGAHSTPKYKERGIPFVSVKDISTGHLDLTDTKLISIEEHEELYKRCDPQKGDILLSKVGTTGIPVLVDTNVAFSLFVSVALLKFNHHDINPFYLIHLLSSPLVQKQCKENTKGVGNKNWVMRDITNTLIVIPPYIEQLRIVEKIKELEPLIDNYKQVEEKLFELNSNIKKQLKKSILQYAIEGKLVPQDPNDEPASILLERIHKEKEKLIAEGKIKKDKNESIIYRRDNSYYEKLGDIETCINDKLPYDLPAGWSWCNVGSLFTNSTGLSYKKDQLNKKSNSMVRILRGGNILEGNYILNSDDVFISSEFVNDNLYLKKGYMITPSVTSLEHIGKIALIDKDYNNIVVGGFVLMLKPVFNCHILLEYLLLFFSTNYYREECRKITHKSGQAFYNLSKDKLMKLYIAIPPLNEQKQIVDKYYQISRLFVL